jgi:MarR family transcriptional regulator, organic hydroperoxide resistance regulator
MSGSRSKALKPTNKAVTKESLDRIVETVIYLQTESRRLAKEQCAKLGVTATQLNVLKLLLTVGDLSLSELSRQMVATNSTVTGIVDRMVAANLVAREQSATDRRVWKIRLTPDGKAVAKKVEVAPWEILQRAVFALPPAELEQLIHTLLKVVDSVEAQIGKRPAQKEAV